MRLIALIAFFIVARLTQAGMTLNDCLVYARDHAHRNIVNSIEVRQAAADSRLAASALMPEVDLSASGNMSFGRNIDPETNTYDNRKTLYSGFGLQMSIPLFDGLVGVNNLRAAKTGRLRREEGARADADEISIEVIKAFYNVSYCKAMVGQMEQQLERDLSNLRAVEKGVELGTKSGADLAEVEAIVAADRYELTNQNSLLEKAHLRLKSCMGMPMDDGAVPELTEEEYEGEADAGFENPRIAEARLALKESRYYLKAAKGRFSPVISLNMGVSTSYYRIYGDGYQTPRFSQQWRDNMGRYVGFTVGVPLFTGLSRINGVRKASLEVSRREILLDEARYEADRQKAEARLDLESAVEELCAAEARVRAEEAAYNAVQRKFELGGASAIDLYTSGAKLATARANFEGKRIRRIISRILLGYYNGEKLIK